MKRTWTIIGVADVSQSFKWYQSLLGLPETVPAHDYFGQIVDSDGTVLLCLHEWGAHEHPTLTSPHYGALGNGLLLFFRVDNFDVALPRARALVSRLEDEPHVNPSTGTTEFSLRDPDGYYVTISALNGEIGPYAQKPVYDPVIQAYSGLATVQAGADDVRPRMLRTILPDKLTAITASQAITAALLARARTGEGQHVRLSMLEAVVAFLWPSDMGDQTFVGDEPPTQEKASATDLVYETGDGWITVAVQTNAQWVALTQALGHPEWLDDERFKTPALRQRNVEARLALTQQALVAGSSDHWLDRLTKAGVPCAPVLTRNELIRAPQVEALGLVVESDHPGAGRLRQARNAARFQGTPAAIRRGAPALGEQTQEILAEAGYSAAEIAGLRADGVITGT